MQAQSQAALERQLEQRTVQLQNGTLSFEQAFGTLEDWIITLGERKAFLHPNLRQWMWYDRLHDEWVFAGCGVGEAILLTVGRTGGIKRLPHPGSIEDWCVYRQEQTLHGPLRIVELLQKLNTHQIPKDILIWSTQSNDWLNLAVSNETTLSLSNSANEIVCHLKSQGELETLHQSENNKKGK